MNIKKKIDTIADDALLEIGEIQLTNKNIKYPTKTISKSKITLEEVEKIVKTGARINEIYKRIEKKTNLENEAEKISDKIRREIQHNLLNIVIIDWVKERLPTES
ncbi:MAG: hypothetical protein ACTSVB_04250 [Candidatus Heimdallarchaeaceae archaeon]